MNFLSHFYYDRQLANPYHVLGGVLPDLLKNAIKDPNLHPEKTPNLFKNPNESSILHGWEKHLAIDRHFHSAPYFFEQTHTLKEIIKPITEGTLVRPSFLAHIGFELVLDHLLADQRLVSIDKFYNNLLEIDKKTILDFLSSCHLNDPERFIMFYNQFLSSKYLYSYNKLENIGYALNRICMRLWPVSLSEQQVKSLNDCLLIYKPILKKEMFNILDDVEAKLKLEGL